MLVPKRENHYRSPVLPLDYPADDDPIWPCSDCLPWHVEVVQEPTEDGGTLTVIREWHAVGCPIFEYIARPDGDDAAPRGE